MPKNLNLGIVKTQTLKDKKTKTKNIRIPKVPKVKKQTTTIKTNNKVYKSPRATKKTQTFILPDPVLPIKQAQPVSEQMLKKIKEAKEQTEPKEAKEPKKEEEREFFSKETAEMAQGIAKAPFNAAIKWLVNNEYITPEQESEARNWIKSQTPGITLTLDAISEALPFFAPLMKYFPKTPWALAFTAVAPFAKKGRKAFGELMGFGIGNKEQLLKNIRQLQSQGVSNAKIANELNKLTGGAGLVVKGKGVMTNEEFLNLLGEAEKIVGKEPMVERTYKSGNKLKWVEALRLWNSGKQIYCVPKKGTNEYNEVMEIMKTGIIKKPEMVKVEKKQIPKVDIDTGIMEETKDYQNELKKWIKSGKKGEKPKMSNN